MLKMVLGPLPPWCIHPHRFYPAVHPLDHHILWPLLSACSYILWSLPSAHLSMDHFETRSGPHSRLGRKVANEVYPQKCSVLRITRNKSTKIFNYQLHGHIYILKSETDSKYLGVLIKNKLSRNNHTDNVCNTPNSSIAFLGRNLQIS